MKDFAKGFYKSRTWQRTRDAYCASRGGLCEDCLTQGRYTVGVIVHHMKELTPDNIGDPGISLAWDNLRLLCRDCHGKRHSTTPKRYKVDESGHVVVL